MALAGLSAVAVVMDIPGTNAVVHTIRGYPSLRDLDRQMLLWSGLMQWIRVKTRIRGFERIEQSAREMKEKIMANRISTKCPVAAMCQPATTRPEVLEAFSESSLR